MKKLFISVPMKNRSEENIRKSMAKMHKIAEAIWEQELEVIPSYIEDKPPEDAKQAVWYLGESIKKLADADYFIGIEYSSFHGCNNERNIAGDYGIQSHWLPMHVAAPDVYEKMSVETTGCVCYCGSGGGGN